MSTTVTPSLTEAFAHRDRSVRRERVNMLSSEVLLELRNARVDGLPLSFDATQEDIARWLVPRIPALHVKEIAEIFRYSGQGVRVLVCRAYARTDNFKCENHDKVEDALRVCYTPPEQA